MIMFSWRRGHNERLAMSKRGKHEPKWHWHVQPSEQDGTGRRLRALCAHGIMKGHVEDVWSQNCETLQLGRDFLYTSKEPKVGQRIEINCTAPSNKYFRMNGVLTSVDNVPPPPGVLPPIMPNCHHMEDHTYDLHFEEFGHTHFFTKANGLAVLSFDFWPGMGSLANTSDGDVRPMCPNSVYAVELTCDWTSAQNWLLTGMHRANCVECEKLDAHDWRWKHLGHDNPECVCKYGDPSLCLRSDKCVNIDLRRYDDSD